MTTPGIQGCSPPEPDQEHGRGQTMNMPVVSPAYNPTCSEPRRLDDDVFQTAEEAVLAEGQGSAVKLPFSRSASAGVRGSGRGGFSLMRGVRAYVAEKPCQSALLAATAGALAMLALRSQLRGRFQRLRPLRLR